MQNQGFSNDQIIRNSYQRSSENHRIQRKRKKKNDAKKIAVLVGLFVGIASSTLGFTVGKSVGKRLQQVAYEKDLELENNEISRAVSYYTGLAIEIIKNNTYETLSYPEGYSLGRRGDFGYDHYGIAKDITDYDLEHQGQVNTTPLLIWQIDKQMSYADSNMPKVFENLDESISLGATDMESYAKELGYKLEDLDKAMSERAYTLTEEENVEKGRGL